MKTLFAFVALLPATLVGCASNPGHPSTGNAPLHPNGTDVGTPFPGVNQPTSSTTATAANDSR